MKRLTYLFVGMVLGGATVAGSLHYHVLRTDEGMTLVPKSATSFEDAYVDVRKFGVADWAKHQSLALAIVKAKREHIFQGSAENSVREKIGSFFSAEK